MGVTSASYRLLAEDLAKQGVATLRIDKRGMFGSKAAIADGNAVTIDAYADDVRNWAKAIQTKTKRKCVWVLGHSEGGLVALKAAQLPNNICGVIAVSAPGRPLQVVLREQLAANPANASLLPDANRALDELSAGRNIDVSAMHPALKGLFAPGLQGFLINVFAQDPAKLAANVTVPMLILQGDKDLQVRMQDAVGLAFAQPKAKLIMVAGMTHALKHVDGDDAAANYATYADPAKPVEPVLVDTIVQFVKRTKN
jgi:alpha-beta hydrolase superfamily lysophospholipase